MNDDALKVHGSEGLALAPFSHNGAIGAGPPAGSVAADRVRPIAQALLITGTDDTGVELGELATPVAATFSP